jgi:hypothetical protein
MVHGNHGSVRPVAIDALLTDGDRVIRDTVRRFVDDRVCPGVAASPPSVELGGRGCLSPAIVGLWPLIGVNDVP